MDANEFGQPTDLSFRFFHLFTYYHSNNRKVAALNLMTNAQRIFSGATVIKNFQAFESIPCGEYQQPPLELVMPFLQENIIDKTRIITCFENFMKAILLLDGYIAHRISSKNKPLRNAQNSRPIGIGEVFNEMSFAQFNPDAVHEHETTSQTLTFSMLMESKYQDVIQLPKDVAVVLTEINDERNKLHFLSDLRFSMGKPVVDSMRRLIDFVANGIILRVINLNQDIQQIKQAFPGDGKSVFTI